MDKKTLEIQIKLLANQALSQVKEFSSDIKNAADKAKGFTGDAKGVSTSIKAMQAEAQRTANQLKLFGLTSSDLRMFSNFTCAVNSLIRLSASSIACCNITVAIPLPRSCVSTE